MIDSDTVVIKDISFAFELLNDFDLMACVEVEHHIDTSNGWHAHGLKDNRLRGFYNAGVLFFNSGKSPVERFMRTWADLMKNGNEAVQQSDQDALNHMFGLPIEFMPDVRFSGSVLKTREYNAFCRYWREIWDAGYWNDVHIVHTYMTNTIAQMMIDGEVNWQAIIDDTQSEFGQFIQRFTSGRTDSFKQRYASTARDRNISIRQFANYELRKLGKSSVEDKAILFAMSPDDAGFDIVSPLRIIHDSGLLQPSAKVTQIGLMSADAGLPLMNRSPFFFPGNDLEFLSELFDADVTAISRSDFLGFKGRKCKTIYNEYSINGNIKGVIEPDQSLIIDIDNTPKPPTRINNAITAKASLSKEGFLVLANMESGLAGRVAERLKPHFSVTLCGTSLLLRHPGVAMPSYLRDYTPFSTAKIALLGNCQSSALASILYRVKGIKIDILVDINGQGSDAYKHAHWAVAHSDRVDFCFSQPLGESFGAIRSERLRKKYGSRFRQYTNLYFTGYHPDLTYFGDRGVRIQSAMGDYNSRIALIGYAKGLTIDETLALFNGEIYGKLNYFSQFDASRAELLRRDEENDVKFAAEFFEIARKRLPLYTVNHPTAHALVPLAAMIVEATGQSRPDIDIDAARNPLVEGSIWPVYPEVANALGLSYPGDTTFYPSFHEERPPMSLREFIGISFELYDDFGRENILSIPGAADLRIQL